MRSAIFLLTFTVVHALGHFVDMLGGPDELNLNGEGYLFDRILSTGTSGMVKGWSVSVVEEYLALLLMGLECCSGMDKIELAAAKASLS